MNHYNTSADADWERQAIVSPRSCDLHAASAQDKGGVGFWLWVAEGIGFAKPVEVAWVPAFGSASVDLRDIARRMQGVYLCASSTPVAKTLILTNDAFFSCAFSDPRNP